MWKRCASAGLLLAASQLSIGCHWVSYAMSRNTIESRELSNRARTAHENGEYQRATQLFAKAIEADPANAELHRRLARAHMANENYSAAVEELRYSASEMSDNADILTELAEAHHAAGDDDQAMRSVRQALERDSTHLAALILHAKLLERSGRTAQAKKAYHQILDLDRENAYAKLRLAAVFLDASQPEQAAPLLRAVCHCTQSKPGERAEARWALGIAYGQSGRWEESAENLAAALPHLNRPTANEWYQLAFAQRQAGNINGARLNVSRALKIDPRHRGAVELAQRTRLVPETPDAAGRDVRFAAARLFPTATHSAVSPARGVR